MERSLYIEKLEKRFLRYVGVTSQSDPTVASVPSTEGQRELGRLLMKEMEELGVCDISMSESGVVYGRLPERCEKNAEHCCDGKGASNRKIPVCGWVCHLDTVDVKLSPDIHPVIVRDYQGGDILQNEALNKKISVAEHPEFLDYIGQDIIVSDGTSVLGADNKAALANIMTVLELLNENENIPHGEMYIAFVPDEETGLRGSKSMDFSRFPVDFAYTIDCGSLGEVSYETFNAGSAVVNITGVPAHPMNSKNNLVNPAMVAVDYINLLDRAETPEHTEGKEGYLWVTDIYTDELTGRIAIDIRDHSLAGYNRKKEYLKKALEITKLKHPKAEMSLDITDVYGNIADAITDDNRICISYIYEAMDELGIKPKTLAMRGGTDGSFISTKGIPTPNYFTGASNFHSSAEFLPEGAYEKSLLLTLKLIELIYRGE